MDARTLENYPYEDVLVDRDAFQAELMRRMKRDTDFRTKTVELRDEAMRLTKQGGWDRINLADEDDDFSLSYWRGKWHAYNKVLDLIDSGEDTNG